MVDSDFPSDVPSSSCCSTRTMFIFGVSYIFFIVVVPFLFVKLFPYKTRSYFTVTFLPLTM